MPFDSEGLYHFEDELEDIEEETEFEDEDDEDEDLDEDDTFEDIDDPDEDDKELFRQIWTED